MEKPGAVNTQLESDESLERFNIIMDGLEAAVYVFDVESNNILYQNQTAHRFYGNLVGKRCWEVFHPNQKSPCKVCSLNASQSFGNGDPEVMVWEFKNKSDGKWYQIYERPTKWIDGRPARVSTSFDITGRKKAEAELRVAKEKAEEATALKDKFVSMMAHDLRSPFTSIMGMLRLIESDTDNPLNKDQLSLLDRAVVSGERLLAMIEKLLNLSRLQTGKIVPKKTFFQAKVAVATAVSDLAHLAKEKGVRIIYEIPEDLKIYADFDLYIEVIVNLLSNSIKFCRKGDSVTIYVPEGRPDSIAVRDTGVGISEDLLPNLFKSEITTTTRGTAGEAGTGLGLPFCHDIMEANGGSLEVESKPGEGTVFYINLPKVTPTALILEDSDDVRRKLEAEMAKFGLEAETAKIDEVGAIVEMAEPHVVVIGPSASLEKTGHVINALKNHDETVNIPIIALIADCGAETKKKALAAGVSDVVPFPDGAGKLSLALKKHFD